MELKKITTATSPLTHEGATDILRSTLSDAHQLIDVLATNPARVSHTDVTRMIVRLQAAIALAEPRANLDRPVAEARAAMTTLTMRALPLGRGPRPVVDASRPVLPQGKAFCPMCGLG